MLIHGSGVFKGNFERWHLFFNFKLILWPEHKSFSVFYSWNYLAVYYAFKFLPCWIIYLFCRNQRRRYISSVNWDRREIISVKQNSRSGDHKNNLHPLSTCLIGFVENMRRVFLSKIHGLIWSEVVSQINGVLCSWL